MISDSIPKPVLQHWFAALEIRSATAVRPGMSGAVVYVCQATNGDRFALKRWPDATKLHRLHEVHRVMSVAVESGCLLVPRLFAAAMEVDHYCWDLVQWMPGEPLSMAASTDQIARGAAAIAQFHACTANLPRRHQIAPAITERLRRLHELDQQMGSVIEASRLAPDSHRLSQVTFRAAQLLALKWKQVRPAISQALSKFADRKVATQYVIRDVHREHLLFSSDHPSGLIDFDAIRVDTPAVDLARWVGSGWLASHRAEPRRIDEVWEAALAGFRSQSPSNSRDIGTAEAEIARRLYRANLWISLANWLVWVLIEQRSFPAGNEAVAKRISALTDAASLDT